MQDKVRGQQSASTRRHMSSKASAPASSSEPRLGRRSSTEPRISANDLARVALDLFAERHYASVSIKEIGRAAGVNSAMIYYHFKDKEDLFAAAIQNAIDEAFQLFEQHCHIDDHEHAMAAIEAWFDIHVILHRRLRNVVKISLDANGLANASPVALRSIKGFYDHEMEILRSFIQRGIETKLFKPVDDMAVATMISTSLDGIMARSLILEEEFDLATTVEEFKRTIALRLGLAQT
jgi:AcrR family transcriptional regulator